MIYKNVLSKKLFPECNKIVLTKMRRLLLIVAVCFLAIATTGCKKARLRVQLKELMGSTIVLPEKVTCVYNGEVFPMPDSLRDKRKLIVYIDSTECTTCRISHLWEYQDLFNLSAQTGSFDVLLLMCNTEFESIPLIRYLSDQNLPYPVYVDTDKVFLKDNQVIPSDTRMHSLFVDSAGRPLFVGDPSRSGHMMTAFKLALQNNQK